MKTDNKLEESVQSWKETVDTNAFADSVGAFAEATVSASPIIDKVSTWAAAGTATVAGLAITNIDKMSAIYSSNEIKWLFSFLAFSLFFSLIQKYLAMVCLTSLEVIAEVKSKLTEVLSVYNKSEKEIEEISDEHDLGIKAEYDFNKVLEAYINLYPKWALRVLKPRFEKSLADRNYSHKNLIETFFYQSMSAFLQFLSILVFICLATVFL